MIAIVCRWSSPACLYSFSRSLSCRPEPCVFSIRRGGVEARPRKILITYIIIEHMEALVRSAVTWDRNVNYHRKKVVYENRREAISDHAHLPPPRDSYEA